MRDIEYGLGGSEHCEVCGNHVDNCICPECPCCGMYGDPQCYVPGLHGLIRSPVQNTSAKAAIKRQKEDDAAEEAMWREYDADMRRLGE